MEAPQQSRKQVVGGGGRSNARGGAADEATYFTDEVRAHLKEHGWARLKGVVPKEATAAFKEGVETYFRLWDEELTFDNPKAWAASKLPAGSIHGINKIGGHAWFMWHLRQRPEVVQMWAEYFRCDPAKLRVSFDGFGLYLAETARRAQGNWAHFDHGTTPKPFKCLQSAVVMEDCDGDDDGGLVVWDKSHRAHDGYFRVNGLECKDNWHLFPFAQRDGDGAKLRNERQPFIAEIERDGRRYLDDDDPERHADAPVPMRRTRVRAKEGDVLVWYSDTAHQNDAPGPDGRDRIVAYVSMAPVQHVLKREFVSRRRAFNDRATSSHWAACGFKRNGMPRTYTTAAAVEFKARYQAHVDRLPPMELTEVGKRLAGLYDEPHDMPPVLPKKMKKMKKTKKEDDDEEEEDGVEKEEEGNEKEDEEEEEGEEEEEEEVREKERERERKRKMVAARGSSEKTAKGRLQKKLKLKRTSTPSKKRK